jgi:hypothetical protein
MLFVVQSNLTPHAPFRSTLPLLMMEPRIVAHVISCFVIDAIIDDDDDDDDDDDTSQVLQISVLVTTSQF